MTPQTSVWAAARHLPRPGQVNSCGGSVGPAPGGPALIATIEPTADLAAVTAAVDRVGADLNQALAEPALAARVHLHPARRARSGPRVS